MKRVISVLLLSACLCLLVGCNTTDNGAETNEGFQIGNFYSVKVTGDKSSLMQPVLPMYKAGTVVEIKAHSITDDSLHVFVNGKEIPMSHCDSDYWGFEFVMPEESITVHLTYDQFYGKEEYAFGDLYSLDFIENEVVKVFVKTTNYTEEYSVIETRYSTRQSDIDSFKAITDQGLIKFDNNIASAATCGREYGFYYNTESHGERIDVLRFGDAFFKWNDFSSWQAFRFEDENYVLPIIEDPDLITYSFRYDGLSSDVKKYGDVSFSIRYFNISSVEFVLYTPTEQAKLPQEVTYYLDSRYGTINLLTATVFEWNGEYYQIVSGEEYWAYSYCQLESN